MKRFLKIFLLSLGSALILLTVCFFTIRKLDSNAMEAADFFTSTYTTAGPLLLPSRFINGERFYIKMAATAGDTMLGFGDTGGGISMLMPAAAQKPGTSPLIKTALLKGVFPVKYIRFADLVADARIPPPAPLRGKIFRTPFRRVTEPHLMVPPNEGEIKAFAETAEDVFLGQDFFMGRAWTFDYPRQQVWVNTPIPASERGAPGVQVVGFKKNRSGVSVFGHPSMQIEVDGQLINVLFDTGATMILSEEGKKALGTQDATKGASFIAASVFDGWRQRHPDWKFYPGADGGRDVIEVPAIRLSGLASGPVLFAKRPDEAWSQGMIHSMDKVVKGAIGGSALLYYKVTIDYNSELIKFEIPVTQRL